MGKVRLRETGQEFNLAPLRKAFANRRATRAAEAQARATVDRVKKTHADSSAKRNDFRKKIGDVSVAALLGGEEVPRPSPDDLEHLRKAEADRLASEEALPLAIREHEKTQGAVRQADADVTTAQLSWVCGVQESARAEIVAGFDKVTPLLATLWAVDSLQERLLGARFVVKDGAVPRPWSGVAATKRLIGGLVERLRPPSFAEAELNKLAASELRRLDSILEDAAK
jgi:hypothetical protein